MLSSIVIPTYNEAENLPPLLEALRQVAPQAHVLIVDDASPDGTAALAAELDRRLGPVEVLSRPGKMGLGSAYVEGFTRVLQNTRSALIYQMDADLSHDPAYLPAFAAKMSRFDLAVGSRWTQGGGTVNWSLARKAISRTGSRYCRLFFPGLPLSDCTSGFKCFRREVLEQIDLPAIRSNGYSFQIEMNVRAAARGFVLGEVPIIFEDRRVGKSKLSQAIVAEAVLRVPIFRVRQWCGRL